MNTKNLKILAAGFLLLFTFLFSGCAQNNSADGMGDKMNTTEKPMDTGVSDTMEKPMDSGMSDIKEKNSDGMEKMMK